MDTWSSEPFPGILNQFFTQESGKSAKNSLSYKPLKFKFVRKLKPGPRNGAFGKNFIGHRFCYSLIVSGRTKWDLNRFSIT